MKRLLLLILLAFSIPTLAVDTTFDWSGLERSKISLEAPLLIVKGSLGFLGCGYINTDSCIDEACAIVSGVNTHDDMLKASVKKVRDRENWGENQPEPLREIPPMQIVVDSRTVRNYNT